MNSKLLGLPNMSGLPAPRRGHIELRPSSLIDPLKLMIRDPERCWVTLSNDGRTAQALFEKYVFLLAAIPSVAGFIGHGLLGRSGILNAAILAALGYFAGILFLYSAAYVAHRTSMIFDGDVSFERSAKLVVYSLMPYFLAGIFLAHPVTSPLSLAGVYSFYLFYVGTKTMTRLRTDRRLVYCAINIVSWMLVTDYVLQHAFA